MVQVPAEADIFSSLKTDHPRLLLDGAAIERIGRLIETDPRAKRWYAGIKADADEILDDAVAAYEIPDGKRLLSMSRKVADRMHTLGLVWLVERDRRYADRAWRDLEAAANFPDWNPSHFLDTGEMTAAFAIGYDWMFDAWTNERKRVIREAIVNHGLEPGLASYRGEARYGWWRKSHHNWNQVCNGGLLAGALAIADEQPAIAAAIVREAVASLPLAMQTFAPDGGWFEGPGYWGYAMRYNVLALACLDSALGTDFGLSKMPGFDKAGDFYVQMRGASGMSFNYADARPQRVQHPALFWLARRFDRPALAAYQIDNARGHVTDLLWYDPDLAAEDLSALPTAAKFGGVEVAAARTSWTDPDAMFVGVKAGRNGVNHDNLDLGSFVFDALGERWVIDLGPDDYNLPHYFGKLRYHYYRLRAEGHNTLVINPGRTQPDQNPKAFCEITGLERTDDATTIATDLTPAYADHGARRVVRTFTLDANQLTVTDRVELDAPGEVWWFCHVGGAVELAEDGKSATIKIGGKSATVTIDEPADAKFALMPAAPLPSSPDPEGQNPNNGAALVNPAGPTAHRVRTGETPQWGEPNPAEAIGKLAIRLNAVETATIRVALRPESLNIGD